MSIIEKIRKYWDLHIYTKRHLGTFVVKGVITAEQYEQITGEPYSAE